MEKQIYQYLSGMPHFSFLPKEERQKMAAAAVEENYPKGTPYAVQGQSMIDNIFIVKKGSLALFDEKKGAEKPTGFIKPGEVFGGITILLNAGISLIILKMNDIQLGNPYAVGKVPIKSETVPTVRAYGN